MKKILLLSVLCIHFVGCVSGKNLKKFSTAFAPKWTHLELGAGNYGEDGHNKIAMSKTVMRKLEKVTEKENFIDSLSDDPVVRDEKKQYHLLFSFPRLIS
jgi:hypothetical protein